MAVDYVKTGQPAQLSRGLKPLRWPHFMEKVGKKQHQIYTSKRVLGQLYDQVERIDFVPAFTAPFDTRILDAYTLDENILRSASEVKEEYDAHMHRIMAQQEIKTEFEVWSTFVLQHSSTSNDFKYHEQIGEISMALKDQFRIICHKRAGGKDHKHIGPFAAAMYQVTARQVTQAVEECHCIQMVGGQPRPLREMTPSKMPLMSFPWLFPNVLGKIANSSSSAADGTLTRRRGIHSNGAVSSDETKTPHPKRGRVDHSMLGSGDYLKTSKGTTHPGELLELFGESSDSGECKAPDKANCISSGSISVKSSNSSKDTSVERGSSMDNVLIDQSCSSSPEILAQGHPEDYSNRPRLPVESDSKSSMSSVSHPHESELRLRSQEWTDVVALAEKKQIAALKETCLQRVCGDAKAVSLEPDYTTPERANLQLLSDLMMSQTACSNKVEELQSSTSHNETKNALEKISSWEEEIGKTNKLLNADTSNEAEKDKEKGAIAKEGGNVNDHAGYSSDSDAGSDEVALSTGTKAKLVEQLAALAQNSTDQTFACSKSESASVSYISESESQVRE